MSSSRTTSIGGVISLLGAFVAAAMVLGLLAAGLFMPAVGATGALARNGVDIFNELPGEFKTDPLKQQSRILAADGKVIATPAEQNRIIVPLDQVAPIMRKAQVAIEDHRFYDHGGFDLQGVVRAAIANVRTGATTSGASSLTQQYVKISLQYTALNQGDEQAAAAAVRKDYLRKLKEVKYAITLEKQMTKDEILAGYLNLVYYGDQAYGVEAASRHYFSVPASKLTLSQAALLAGLTQNPGITDPVNYPERALARRNVVLDRMHELKIISDVNWQAAKKRTIKQDLKVSEAKSTCLASPYPYWCEFVINYVETMPELGKTVEQRRRLLRTGGLTVHTTLDPKIQKIVQEEVTRKVPIGDKSDVGAAAYVTEPGTGKVLGFAQNTEYTVGKQSRGKTGVSWALDKQWGGSSGFQFGSTAKAFSLLTAMESGMTTHARVNAKAASSTSAATYQPREFGKGCGPGGPWRVLNDSAFGGGSIDLMKATALSTNTAFVALAQQVGGCKVWDTMARLGLKTASGQPIPKYAPAYILGAAEVSPQGVANSYATLAADGKKCSMVVVTKVSQGSKTLAAPKTKCEQIAKADYVRGTHKFLEYNMTQRFGHPQPARRTPVRRQDRDVRQEQRVVVRRLHAQPRHRSLGRHSRRWQQAEDVQRAGRWKALPGDARGVDRRADLEGHHEPGPRGPARQEVQGAVGQDHQGRRGVHPQRHRSVGGRREEDPRARGIQRRRGRLDGLERPQGPGGRHVALRQGPQGQPRHDLPIERAGLVRPGCGGRPGPSRHSRSSPRLMAATRGGLPKPPKPR